MSNDSGNTRQGVCCICGRELPNRYSVAGVCGTAECKAAFCALHWHRGNRRCTAHGYEETNPVAEDDNVNEQPGGKRTDKTGGALKEALGALRKVGAGTAALMRKIRKDRSPAAVIAAMEEQLRETEARKDKAAAEVERLHGAIVSRKREAAGASKARREILEEELRSLLTAYNAAKRTYKILLENERHMQLVKGRLSEVGAYGMSPVTETMMDDVIDQLDDSVDEAEAVADAARDLEKAGRRRERAADLEGLWDALSEFDEDEDMEQGREREPGIAPVMKEASSRPAREGSKRAEQED